MCVISIASLAIQHQKYQQVQQMINIVLMYNTVTGQMLSLYVATYQPRLGHERDNLLPLWSGLAFYQQISLSIHNYLLTSYNKLVCDGTVLGKEDGGIAVEKKTVEVMMTLSSKNITVTL